MHPQNRPVRFNGVVSTKRNMLGNRAGHPPPAWRSQIGAPSPGANVAQSVLNGKGKETGSKILLSKLPLDVGDKEVEELFKKTVGPLKDAFLIYNSQGKSKGMAVVTFQRPGDAAVARAKYDGKIVDGRRPLKIEIVYDGAPQEVAASVPPPQPSLLDRLSQTVPAKHAVTTAPVSVSVSVYVPPTFYVILARIQCQRPLRIAPVTLTASVPPRRVRQKKGPKRLKKRGMGSGVQQQHLRPASKEQLDKEMDAYRAEVDVLSS
ncbi:hypothetical protein M378DRAFT_90962 [Amanita muscaria Koide BX008]|uniref:RRM domain-containing protein n=1 Tax=Amanita muscaria (strain Koide BX008) TaxID=946122 RepID=A0A0C2W2R5_AMAMK|nr:hypothetical protein M378DRAFT_90962 [Amanita muscaria Koide BX008]